MKERLQKLIASAGLCSRRQAEQWLKEGRVTLNGGVAELGAKADPALDRIEIDGRPLRAAEARVSVLLNKPAGYVTTLQDPQGRPVVTDLLEGIPERLFPVGRLDFNTEGLLILTNDGDLAWRLAHPRHQVEKAYLVRVRGPLSPQARRSLEKGVRLEDGLTAPARVQRVRSAGSHTWFELCIHEGRNRQVRRMCQAVEAPVSRLRRIRIGFLELGELRPGQWRYLREDEVEHLKKI